MRRRRALATVGVALAAVVLAIVGLEVVPGLMRRPARSSQAAQAAAEQSVEIVALDPGKIETIELVSGTSTTKLHREGGTWMLVAPITGAAKPEAVADLLESFSGMYSERVVEEQPEDLARYGLAEPAVLARVTLSDGSTRELLLGDQTPAGTTWYLMASGDSRVFAVWMNHGQHLAYTVNDFFRARRVLTVDTALLSYVRILRDGARMVEVELTPELVRSDAEMRSSYLSVTYPYARPKPLDSFGLSERFLVPLGDISIAAVADPDPKSLAPYGLDRPSFEVVLKDDRATMDLLVGKTDGELVFVRVAGERPVYAAPRELADLVGRQKPFDWVTRFAAIVAMKSVDRVTISSPRGTHTLTIARTGSGDDVLETYGVDGAAADARPFRDFYQRMVSIEVDSLTDDLVADRDPDLVITYHLIAGGKSEYRVSFVPYSPDFYVVVKNGESDLLVNRGQISAFLEAAEELARSPRVKATP